jgi:two-component system alkaline phosphatase synthesis response regulator PhoP
MRKKILIVEDNSELLELMRLGLEQAGFRIATASNGVDALKSARSGAPDLIVLDLVLPELDGFAVCERLRKDEGTASIPVIVLTGLSSEFARFASIESGADEYVMKPVGTEDLVSKIKALLSRPRKPRPSRPAQATEVS